MKRLVMRLAAAGLAAAALIQPGLAQNSVAETGFRIDSEQDLVFGQIYASFADGRYFSFDGVSMELHDPSGGLLQVYAVFIAQVFPSFVELDPTESFAYVGESSAGAIFKVDIFGGTVSFLTNLHFNYDLEFDTDPGFGYVSAATGGFGVGNDLFRMNLDDGTTVQVAHVDGPSGPVTVDATGALYYVTQSPVFPPPGPSSNVISWTHDQLLSGALLTEADATVLAGPYEGGSDIQYDPRSGHFFLCETDFVNVVGFLRQIDPDGNDLGVVASAFDFISNIEIFDGGGTGTFFRFQPENTRLLYQFTGFGPPRTQRVTFVPQRAESSFAGPSGGAAGPATVTIAAAYPGGFVEIFLARSNNEQVPEVVTDLGWGAPIHTAVELADIARQTPLLAVDANGEVSLNYFQPAMLDGAMLFQAFLYDGTGVPLGTSTHVINF